MNTQKGFKIHAGLKDGTQLIKFFEWLWLLAYVDFHSLEPRKKSVELLGMLVTVHVQKVACIP